MERVTWARRCPGSRGAPNYLRYLGYLTADQTKPANQSFLNAVHHPTPRLKSQLHRSPDRVAMPLQGAEEEASAEGQPHCPHVCPGVPHPGPADWHPAGRARPRRRMDGGPAAAGPVAPQPGASHLLGAVGVPGLP